MRIQQKNRKKTTLFIVIVLLGLVGILFSVYLYRFHGSILSWQPFPEARSTINYEKPTKDQKDAGNNIKEQSVNENVSKSTGSTGTDQAPVPTPQSNGKSKADLTITAANQNGSLVQIRSDLLAVTNSGECTLTLTQGSRIVTKTSGVQALSSSSTCKGFDVPTNELVAGSWQLSLHFENSQLVADATKVIIVQ